MTWCCKVAAFNMDAAIGLDPTIIEPEELTEEEKEAGRKAAASRFEGAWPSRWRAEVAPDLCKLATLTTVTFKPQR